MKSQPHVLHACVLACLVLTLAGCSGGSARGPVSAGSQSAPGQVASALFVKQWGQILWGLESSQTGTGTPRFGDPIFNPDGSVSQTYTGPDGTQAVITGFPDGSVTLEITYPDGATQTVEQSVPQFDGVSTTTLEWLVTSSRGLSVTYTSVVDDRGTVTNMSDDRTHLQGSSRLPDDLRQDFEVTTSDGETQVQSDQSDGSTFTLTVPLGGPDLAFPDFSQASTGTYATAGVTSEFTLASTAAAPGRWASMSSELGDGVTGEFSLAADFSGGGRLLQNNALTALVSWTGLGDTDVDFVSAEHSATSPAGAAADYLIHRWQTLAALLAPAPGVASVQYLSRMPITSAGE